MNTPSTAVPVRIDFVSDVVCPWCAIGLASLEQAIARVGDDVAVELHVQPFELNPDMPPEGEPIDEHLGRKYGLSPVQLQQNRERLRERGADVGVDFAMGARTRTYNTFDAHRLLHWAAEMDKQVPLKHALLRAYFTDGENVSDHATLVRLAAQVGLPADRAAAILASNAYADEVRADEQMFLRAGISSVPAIILDREYLISGGQPVEVFEQALRQIAGKRRG
ncbi:DsbA family oxidoreductase [Lysobacter sp. TY2-98]|uniref:DsbA family oxidoreductase n=1 Tax=Lysobacter sp. TY2-98 TaxID=2290922 RepID=UPI000E204CC5|nr:DsbA family oxidoreductase [Lysobacter sp. TY2-98]AXK72819.1 DsbA family oxidoreductase [Lysobacter sp. TY2-98]